MNNDLRLIDTNTAGPRYDATPLFSDYGALSVLVEDLARPFANAACDYLAGIDALGFIPGAAVALRLQKGNARQTQPLEHAAGVALFWLCALLMVSDHPYVRSCYDSERR